MDSGLKSYLSSMVVLYVEDEEDIREELEEFLMFRVKVLHTAKDGAEGLKIYKEYSPDIILSDIKMPNMDGLAMSEEIKKINKDRPIVITTAFNDTNYLMKAIEIGVDKYVTKPIKPDLLIDALESVSKVIYQAKELKKKQFELKELNTTLQEKVVDEVKKNRYKDRVLEFQSRQAQMGEMISAIAHQWKQPLNIISIAMTNFSLQFEMSGGTTMNNVDNLEKDILKQINYMTTTLDEFRNFFKPTKEKNIFSLKKSIDEVLHLIGGQYQKQHLEINIKGDEEVKVNAYKNEFEQVIINLLNNARDAMEEKKIQNRKIKIEVFEYSNKGVVTIVDNAGGIREEVLEKIFEPYVTTKSEDKGTGIGLYMSKTIIEKVNGKISVENIKDGAKFTIEIPQN